MATHRIDIKDLGRELAGRRREIPQAVERGLRQASMYGVALLARRSPTYLGQLKNSWDWARSGEPRMHNTAPHAGIVERGARPHPVSREGVEAIRMWVIRKLLRIPESLADQNEEVDAITWAIVNKIRRYGQKPTYFVRDSLPRISRQARTEVEGEIRDQSNRRFVP